jgi:RHS repeat-associated protein
VTGTDLLYDGRGFLRDALLTYSGSGDFEHTEPIYSSEGLLYSRRWTRQRSYGTPQDNAPAPILTDDQTTHVFYFAGQAVAQWNDGSGLTYLITDHLGTPVLATNPSGTAIWQGGFTPFGAPYHLMDPSLFLRLPGQWVDSSWSGYGEELYYNVNRHYETLTGRYTKPDPLGLRGGAFHVYSYAVNNPLSFVDPLGLTVYRCCRDVEVNQIVNAVFRTFNLKHCFLKTDMVEAGMGPADNGPLPTCPRCRGIGCLDVR